MLAITTTIGFSSFIGEDESGSGSCNLCVVKEAGTVIFSCKSAAENKCRKERTVNDPTYGEVKVVVSCDNAIACPVK